MKQTQDERDTEALIHLISDSTAKEAWATWNRVSGREMGNKDIAEVVQMFMKELNQIWTNANIPL